MEFLIARMSANDYAEFVALMSDIPKTYDEWIRKLEESESDHLERGHILVEVKITPAEFAQFCQSRNCQPNTAELQRCVTEKHALGSAKRRA